MKRKIKKTNNETFLWIIIWFLALAGSYVTKDVGKNAEALMSISRFLFTCTFISLTLASLLNFLFITIHEKKEV